LSGNITLDNQKELQFREADAGGDHYIALKAAAALAADVTLTLPNNSPSAGFVLKAGSSTPTNLEWAADATNTAAADLTGNTLASGVTASSLQSLGTLSSLTIDGDVTFTGASSNGLWDKSANQFVANLSGTASLATEFTVTANNSTDETCYLIFADAATGSQGAETDTGLNYNPSTGLLTSTAFSGSGASLTSLNGSNISSGTIAAARVDTLNQNTTGTAAGLTGTPNISVGTIGCGNITGTGTITDSKGELRTIPQLSKSASHVIVAGDAGQHSINSSGGWTINTSTGFTAGQAITLINNSSGDQTITSTGVTLYNSADGSTPTKIATRGMATVICTASNTYYISGAGLS